MSSPKSPAPTLASSSALAVPTLEGVEAARKRLQPHLNPTPCFRSELLSRAFKADVWLKVEATSPVASFKIRGALNSLLVAQGRGGLKGAVTSSTGNHGQGVAYSARILGIPSQVFVPNGANPVKMQMMRSFGAQLTEEGSDIDETKEIAEAFAKEKGFFFVDDGEDLEMMHGAGTVGLEIAEALPQVDELFVPMGSGTLVCGSAAAVKSRRSTAKVTAVQARGAPAMTLSFKARKPVEHAIATIAEGLVCRVPAKRALAALLHWVDDSILVDDNEILSALRTLVEAGHVLVEPSGAAALAGAWSQRSRLAGKRVAIVLTGANITPEMLQRALQAPPLWTTLP